MCREIYHGTRWNTDTRFSAPIVSLSHDIPACVSEGLCHFSPSTSGACYWNSCSILPKGMCKCVIYKSGTARMVSGYQDTKDAFEY